MKDKFRKWKRWLAFLLAFIVISTTVMGDVSFVKASPEAEETAVIEEETEETAVIEEETEAVEEEQEESAPAEEAGSAETPETPETPKDGLASESAETVPDATETEQQEDESASETEQQMPEDPEAADAVDETDAEESDPAEEDPEAAESDDTPEELPEEQEEALAEEDIMMTSSSDLGEYGIATIASGPTIMRPSNNEYDVELENCDYSAERYVDDSITYYYCPVVSFQCPYCGDALVTLIPSYYWVDGIYSKVTDSQELNFDVVKPVDAKGNARIAHAGSPINQQCLATSFQAIKPGTANVYVDAYYNYNYSGERGNCGSCGGGVRVPADKKWYAQYIHLNFTINADYVLNYDANGGSNAPAPTTVIKADTSANVTVTNSEPTREGYTFLGWAETTDATDAQYHAGDSVTLNWESGRTTSKTLFAVWKENKPSVPDAPKPSDLYSILGAPFVKVKCVSMGPDGKTPIHAECGYTTWSQGDAAYQIGEVYENENAGVYYCDVTLDGNEYVARYSKLSPSQGAGKKHALKSGQPVKVTLKLKYNNSLKKWENPEEGKLPVVFEAICEEEVKKEVTDFTKERLTSAPTGITITGDVNYDAEPVIPADGSITLLYKITVSGTPGTSYVVTDEDATYAGGDPMEGTIPEDGDAVIYVTKKFTQADVADGMVNNTANVTPGTGSNGNSSVTAGTTVKIPEITDLQKEWIKSADGLPEDIDVGGVAFANENGRVTIPKGGSVKLLFKITVSGNPGTDYTVTDEDAVHAGGDPMEGTIPEDGDAVIYVTKEYQESDKEVSISDPDVYYFTNTAKVEPGKEADNSTDSVQVLADVDVPGLEDGDLTITKTASKEEVLVGEEFTYTLKVQNNTPDSVEDLIITDVLPDGIELSGELPEGVAESEGTLTWSVGTLGVEDAESVEIPVKATKYGKITNTVTAAVGGETVPTDDGTDGDVMSATVEVRIPGLEDGDLTLTKTASAGTVTVGSPFQYTLSVANNTGVDIPNVSVTDELPVGVELVSGQTLPSGVTYDEENRTITWNIDNLSANDTQSITFSVTATAAGTITNDMSAAVMADKAGEDDGTSGTSQTVPTTPTDPDNPGTTDPDADQPSVDVTVNPAPTTPGGGTGGGTGGGGGDTAPTPTPATAPPAALVAAAPAAPAPTAPAAPAPTAPAPAPAVENIADENVPLADGEDASVEPLTELEDEEVPLAGPLDTLHTCCILHLLILLLAMIVEIFYTSSMKKHQRKIFEIRRETAGR